MTHRTGPQVYLRAGKPGKTPERVDLGKRLEGLKYDDEEKKADKLTLTIDNFDLTEFERTTWRKGNIIAVSWGYPGDMSPERQCVIQTIKGGVKLHIEALGREAVLGRKVKSRQFEDMKRSDVAKQLAGEYGYGSSKQTIDDSIVVHEQITQGGVTDYVFLRNLAVLLRWEFFIDFDGFHFHPRRLGQKPHRKLHYYNDPQEGDVLSWSIDNDISAGKPGAVQVKGRDPITKEEIDVKADNSTPRDSPASVLEAISEEDGSAKDVEGVASLHVAPTMAKSKEEAEGVAKGLYTQSQINAVQLSLTIWGDPGIVAKSIVQVAGLGPVFSGNYYVSSAHHQVVPGYQVTLKTKRDGHAKAGGAAQDTKSKATVNNADAPPDDGGLDKLTKVNEQDGTAEESYIDKKGRK